MGWIRDESGCSAENDGTVRIATDRYLLGGGENPVAVAKSPQSYMGGDTGDVPLPARGSAHPIDPGMRLDAYAVETDGAVSSIIAKYSSDARFRFPTGTNVRPEGFRWRITTESIVFEIPFAQKGREYVGRGSPQPLPIGQQGPPAPGDPVYATRWKYLKQRVYGKVQRISMNFKLRADVVDDAIKAIFDQQNVVHKISGKYWLFEGGEVTDGTREDDYECSLNYIRETGVCLDFRDAGTTIWPNDMQSQIPGMLSPAAPRKTWAQAPFHRTVIIAPQTGDASHWPTFESVFQFEYIENGWQALAALIP